MSKYHVFLAPEGDGEYYLGPSASLREARHMAAQHARGERWAMEESLYGTAQAAGRCRNLPAPPAVGAPVDWFGRGRWYRANRAV